MRERIKEKCLNYFSCINCPLYNISFIKKCYGEIASDEEVKENYKIMFGDEDKMNKNYMGKVAEMLDVEIDEEFKVYRNNSLVGTYKITEKGLMYENTSKSDEIVLEDILTGQCWIKQAWKPKKNEDYFVPVIYRGPMHSVYIWGNYPKDDDYYYKKNLVCKTPEEAIELAEVALQAIKKYREG